MLCIKDNQSSGEVLANDYFSVQVLDSKASKKAGITALENGVSTFNYQACENLLREKYKIDKSKAEL